MQTIKKKFFSIFLVFYLIIGSFTSLNTGISFDEYHEEKKDQIEALKSLREYPKKIS